ncbi:MAG: pyridoxamine 5'-phosphate oxidase family protein [Candidatus Omnitrophica bacterium]|nr:pyridoxamine 5'-phosphate oxidase family protein [Candidatus Omnitrophota bacterium]
MATSGKVGVFKDIFTQFLDHEERLKVISVASCDRRLTPNSAPKMLVDMVKPNRVFFLDYKFTRTYSNLCENPKISISFMDDDTFTGCRLTGTAEALESGRDYERAKKSWEKRLISYEADRILKRITGQYSTREAENTLPKDFVIVKFMGEEASMVKPDRVLRAQHRH